MASTLARCALALALGLASEALTPSAWAGEGKADAAKAFKAAEQDFKRHRYEDAAKGFEFANDLEPHPAPLFNAAVAWEKAGDLVRAANLCARYLRDAPADDSRQDKARELVADLTPRVGRLEVSVEGGAQATVDGEESALEVTFVTPGDHVVAAEIDGEVVERKVEVVAGSLVRVELHASPIPSEEPEVDEPLKEEGAATDADAPTGLSPTWVWVGAGVTVALASATIWSGLDTDSAREAFDAEPTQARLADGESKQGRTNALLGATSAVGVVTGVVAVFFTRWNDADARTDDAVVTMGPREIGVSGRF